MSRPATSRLKVNPQLGRMPSLQFCRPDELRIDPAYQRDIANGASQSLVRKIAMYWNWDLCQPLVVARRTDFIDRLFVIDGQHRLEAARQRRDIEQLPCVILNFESVADEAASFVHLNQQRRPLTKLDVFKAAVASGDTEANAIVAAMTDAGLSIAPHQNYISWKPGMVANIGGMENAWRSHGAKVAETAMRALAQGFLGQVLRYAGTIFPGVVAVCADEIGERGVFEEARFERFLTTLGRRSQQEWRAEIARIRAEEPNLKFAASSALALRRSWGTAEASLVPAQMSPASLPVRSPAPSIEFARAPLPGGARWCEQCDMKVASEAAATCKSRFCSLRGPV